MHDVLQVFAAHWSAFQFIFLLFILILIFPLFLTLLTATDDGIHGFTMSSGKSEDLFTELLKLLLCQLGVHDASTAQANPVLERIHHHRILDVELNDELLFRWCVDELLDT